MTDQPVTTATLRLRPGVARRVRELRGIPTEVAQAKLIGVDRTTLRRVDQGGRPSAYFIAQFCATFDLSPGEAFEVVQGK